MEEKKYSNPKKALLVIDIQEDYTGAAAKPPFPYKNSEGLITAVNSIIEECVKNNIIVVYIRQEFEGLLGKLASKLMGHGTVIKGSPGAEIDKRINLVSDNCFSKPLPNGFLKTGLEAFLQSQQVDELYLAGLDAQYCVYETAKGAKKLGYKASVITDAVAMRNEDKWNDQLEKYRKDGINLISRDRFIE